MAHNCVPIGSEAHSSISSFNEIKEVKSVTLEEKQYLKNQSTESVWSKITREGLEISAGIPSL